MPVHQAVVQKGSGSDDSHDEVLEFNIPMEHNFFDRLSGVKHLGHGSTAILFEITCQSTSTIVTHN